jgi:hypothetical protein
MGLYRHLLAIAARLDAVGLALAPNLGLLMRV